MREIKSLNCDRSKDKIKLIIQQTSKHNISNTKTVAILLQEAHLKQEDEQDLIKDRENEKLELISDQHKLITIINKTQCQLESNKQDSIIRISDCMANALICRITINQTNERINLVNIYARPPRQKPNEYELTTFLERIKDATKPYGWSRTIIMGDINGIDPLWCPPDRILLYGDKRSNENTNTYLNRSITRGRTVSGVLNRRMKLTCLNNINDGPTRYNNSENSFSYINICFIGEKVLRKWKSTALSELETNKSNRARHIVLTLRNFIREESVERMAKPKINDNSMKTVKINKSENIQNEMISLLSITNWREMNNEEIKSIMEKMTDILNKTLRNDQTKNLKTKKCKTKQKQYKNKTNNNREQMKLASKLKKLRKGSNKHNKHREQIISRIKKDNKQATSTDWNSDMEDRWREIHNLESLIEISNLNHESKNQNEIYSKTLEAIALEKFPNCADRRQELKAMIDQIEHENDPNHILTGEEIDVAIYRMRKKKHAGVDGIKFRTFLNRIEKSMLVKATVHSIIKMSRHICDIPTNCRTNLGKIIPKKQPGKFRIVHLSIPMSSLIEQTILHELEAALEFHKKTDNRQFGFTKKRGRHDMVAKIIADTIHNKRINGNKANTILISLDIKGAFDNVDQAILINKMHKELCKTQDEGSDNNHIMMVKWLANFLLNKQVILDYNQKRTPPRPICQGVPQGSCLGPILWNYMIESITTKINLNNQASNYEILSYADDILLCMRNIKSADKHIIQARVNELIKELNNIKLDIESQKSSIVYIHVEKRLRDKIKIEIKGTEIKEETGINILGVKITKALRLDMASITNNAKIAQNAYLLQRLQALDMINEQREWRAIIESSIKSIMITNAFPILAVDKTARKKTYLELMKTIKYIFSWSPFASNKTVNMILEQHSITTEIRKMIYKNEQSEFGEAYKMLGRLIRDGTDIYRRGSPILEPFNSSNLTYHNSETRRVANPKKIMKATRLTANQNKNLLQKGNEFLVLLPNGKMTIIAKITKRKEERKYRVMTVNAISIPNYNIGYFTQMAALYDICKQKTNSDSKTNIIFEPNNGLYQALSNYSNTDWRTITLRELIYDTKINIFSLAGIQEMISRKITRTCLKNTAVKTCIWPEVQDYKAINSSRTQLNKVRKADLKYNINSFCRDISTNLGYWKNINPNKISGREIMALSGNITVNSKVTHHNKIDQVCGCTKRTTDNIVLHRMIECLNYATYRQNMQEYKRKAIITFNRYRKNVSARDKTFINHKNRDTVLRIISENTRF